MTSVTGVRTECYPVSQISSPLDTVYMQVNLSVSDVQANAPSTLHVDTPHSSISTFPKTLEEFVGFVLVSPECWLVSDGEVETRQ
jgi:hypothetical protein